MGRTCKLVLDPKSFRSFVRELGRLLDRVPKLPLQLRRRISQLFLDLPNKWFSLECHPADRALRVSFQPTQLALKLLAAVRAEFHHHAGSGKAREGSGRFI